GSRSRLVRAARDAALSGLGRIEAFRRRLARRIAQLTVSYRGSPIVAEGRPGWFVATTSEGATGFNASQAFLSGPRPGDRMPDVLLTQSDPTTGLPLRLSDVVFGDDPRPDAPPAVRHILLV